MDATIAKGGASRRAPASSSASSENAERSRSFFASLPAYARTDTITCCLQANVYCCGVVHHDTSSR